MKKYKFIISLFTIVFLFLFKGCILDDFNDITQNVPISKQFTVSGTTYTDTKYFCLSESNIIQDYQNKIEEIQLLTATYQTISVDPSNVMGDIIIKLYKQDGTNLYSFTLTNVSPANYIDSPIVLQFTDTELQLINAYLSTLKGGTCFQASITVNTNPPGGSVTLTGKIDIAFKMKAKI